MNVIEIKNLTKYYGRQRGIVDVSFNVEEGEIFGFIGPNGAGKSTTIRTILSLVYPTSGSAKIFGKDCLKYGPEIKKEIGYLPSKVFYYENMRVIDLLKYSASFYRKDCSKRIKELAETMDLDLKRRISDLSFGNKKKVGIVQGLVHNPKLIILDEPTIGLDPLMQQKFFDLLRMEIRTFVLLFLPLSRTLVYSLQVLRGIVDSCFGRTNVLISFVLNVAVDLDKKMSFLKFLTPFKYFNARDLMYGGRFEPVFLILSFIIVAAASAATFVYYKRKDLAV